MGANFSRLKTWVKERCKFSDLNGEFNNILNNLTPAGVDDASATLGAMQATRAPAPYAAGVQVPDLATSLEEELQSLRYVMSALTGQSFWYTDPGRLLSVLQEDLIGYLSTDGDNTTEAFSKLVRAGGITNAASQSALDVTSAHFNSTNIKFSKFSVNFGSATRFLGLPCKSANQGAISLWFRDIPVSGGIAYNPLLGIELSLDGTGKLFAKITERTAATETTKSSSSITGAVTHAADTAFNSVILRYVSNAINGAATDSLGMILNGSADGAQLTAQTFNLNIGLGGTWFFGGKKNDPAWNHFSAMSVRPDLEAVNPWTGINPGSAAVSDGVLQIASANTSFQLATNVDMSAMTVETKFRLLPDALVPSVPIVQLNDTSMSRLFTLRATHGYVEFWDGATQRDRIAIDTSQFNVFRLTCSGAVNPVINLYINGALANSFQIFSVNASGADFILFGCNSGVVSTAEWEYMAHNGTLITAPVSGVSTGQLTEIGVYRNSIPDLVVAQVANNAIKKVFGLDYEMGLSFPPDFEISYSTQLTYQGQFKYFYVSDGKTPVIHNASGFAANTSLVTDNEFFLYDAASSAGLDNVLVGRQREYLTNDLVSLQGKRVVAAGIRVIYPAVVASGGFFSFFGIVSASGSK